MRILLQICLAGLLASVALADPPKEECDGHELKAEDIKQQLRRWPGLGSFNRWRLKDVSLDKCLREGAVSARLTLAPPDSWSRHRVPYRVWIYLRLDAASGAALKSSGNDYKKLVSAVRRLVLRAEEHEDVRRFLERFPPDAAEVVSANGPGRLQVTYRSEPVVDGGKKVELAFSEAAEEGIVAYRLPRMDSLPVRRELLHFVETLSQRHPRCRPSWVEARFKPGKPEVEDSGRWEIKMNLVGKGCPRFLRGQVTPEWSVTDLDVGMPDPPK
jgi:hypothetical protein